MISSDVIRGYNDTIILHLLQVKDSYGYEISREIDEITGGNYRIKETTLYSAISRLEKNGFIATYSGTQTQGRPRTYFTITTAGQAYYLDKCKEWELTKQVINQFTQRSSSDE